MLSLPQDETSMLSKLAQFFRRSGERDPYMDTLKEIHSGARPRQSTAEITARAQQPAALARTAEAPPVQRRASGR
jgi:hypothetical protein